MEYRLTVDYAVKSNSLLQNAIKYKVISFNSILLSSSSTIMLKYISVLFR